MDFDIYFCKDGVLRAKYSDKSPMIPLEFIQKKLNQKDLSFWSRWWESNVYFEDGLTVANFLICLEPWADFWGDITLKNVASYIKEVRKPYDISKEKETPLSWIGISYYTELDTSVEYKKENDDLLDRDINAWLNSPKESKLTGEWDIHSSYRVSGYKEGEEEQYSIDYTPMNELANVPIILNDQHLVYISDWRLKKHFEGKEHPIFVNNPFGVTVIERNNNKMNFLIGKKYHKMRDVVEGFFWWMYSEPSRRDDFSESLKDSLEEIKMIENESSENENDNEIEVDSSGEKKLKVNVAPGAFDSLIESHQKEKDFWDDMLSAASKDNSVILKIGSYKVANPPEYRYFGYFEKEKKDLSTDYKCF